VTNLPQTRYSGPVVWPMIVAPEQGEVLLAELSPRPQRHHPSLSLLRHHPAVAVAVAHPAVAAPPATHNPLPRPPLSIPEIGGRSWP